MAARRWSIHCRTWTPSVVDLHFSLSLWKSARITFLENCLKSAFEWLGGEESLLADIQPLDWFKDQLNKIEAENDIKTSAAFSAYLALEGEDKWLDMSI